MIFYTFGVIFILWLFRRHWKMRKFLTISRRLRNKYIALPIMGHGYMFAGTGEAKMEAMKKFGYEAMKSPFGLTSVWLGHEYITVTCDPVAIENISKDSLEKTDWSQIIQHLIGNGSGFAPTHIWRPRRKVLAPIFCQKNLNSFIEIFAEQSLIMASSLRSRAGNGSFSIWDNISSYTMDSVCQTVLGLKLDAQKHSFNPFVSAFSNYCKIITKILFQPWLYMRLLYKLVLLYHGAEKYKTLIHDFVDDVIRNHKSRAHRLNGANLNTDSKIHDKTATFLELLIKSSGGNSGYTDLELREELLLLLIAGTDTTAVGIAFTTVMLSRNLDVQEKAYNELQTVFGDSKRPVTREDVSSLKYLDAVVKETLRLYPSAPVVVRKHDEDVKLTSGITLPAGSNSALFIYGLHRNPQYWGADAEQFDPDRFLSGGPTHRAAYIPFSYGPRNCIGYKYAMMSMKVLMATLLREYRVLPPSDVSPEDLKKPLRLEFNIMMKHVDNFVVRLEHR